MAEPDVDMPAGADLVAKKADSAFLMKGLNGGQVMESFAAPNSNTVRLHDLKKLSHSPRVFEKTGGTAYNCKSARQYTCALQLWCSSAGATLHCSQANDNVV